MARIRAHEQPPTFWTYHIFLLLHQYIPSQQKLGYFWKRRATKDSPILWRSLFLALGPCIQAFNLAAWLANKNPSLSFSWSKRGFLSWHSRTITGQNIYVTMSWHVDSVVVVWDFLGRIEKYSDCQWRLVVSGRLRPNSIHFDTAFPVRHRAWRARCAETIERNFAPWSHPWVQTIEAWSRRLPIVLGRLWVSSNNFVVDWFPCVQIANTPPRNRLPVTQNVDSYWTPPRCHGRPNKGRSARRTKANTSAYIPLEFRPRHHRIAIIDCWQNGHPNCRDRPDPPGSDCFVFDDRVEMVSREEEGVVLVVWLRHQ